MKKFLTLFILCYWQLHALDIKSTLKIYHDLISVITHKSHVTLYTENREYINVFLHSKKIQVVNTPSTADIILITNRNMLKKIPSYHLKRAIAFTTKYSLLQGSPYIIGALYRKKGRSQILFIRKRLRQHKVILPKEYEKYIIGEL